MSEIFNKKLRLISKFEFTPNGWREIYVRDVCDLGRGRVISHEEIKSNPGPYPVYSSQTSNDGMMGSLDSYEFDSELITWTTDGANAGTVFFRQGKFNCTNVCGTLAAKSADDLDLKFLTYQIGRIAKHYVSYHGNPKLMNDVMGRVALVLPSKKAEQQRIAEILSTIDQAIETTEALIHKYQQIKAGLMHDLFTRGLTANGKLRPPREQAPALYQETPIGWIPKEWDSLQMRNISNVNQGLQIAISERYKNPSPNKYLYITIQYLNNQESETNTFYIEEHNPAVICGYDDVLLVRTGNTGMVVTNVIGVFHNNFFKISYNRDKVNRDFLVFFLKRPEIQQLMLNYAGTTTIPDLKHKDFYKLPFHCPSANEQNSISGILNSINEKILMETKSITKFRQQKSGLMHDLLTGKVPVTVRPEEALHGS